MDSATVTVHVVPNDSNFASFKKQLFEFSVQENTPVGSSIGKVRRQNCIFFMISGIFVVNKKKTTYFNLLVFRNFYRIENHCHGMSKLIRRSP